MSAFISKEMEKGRKKQRERNIERKRRSKESLYLNEQMIRLTHRFREHWDGEQRKSVQKARQVGK